MYKKPHNPDYEHIKEAPSKLPALNLKNKPNDAAAIRISMLQDENLLSDRGELSPNNAKIEIRSSQPHSELEGHFGSPSNTNNLAVNTQGMKKVSSKKDFTKAS